MKRPPLTPEYFLGRVVPFNHRYTIAEARRHGANGWVFRADSDELSASAACKIIPRSKLRDTWQEEFRRANLTSAVLPSVVRIFDAGLWLDEPNGIDCVALLAEWVNGPSLAEFIGARNAEITLPFCEALVQELLALLHAMQQRGVTHGDIHSGNVLIEDRAGMLGGPRFSFRVNDFGVASAHDAIATKDDFDQTAIVLKQLLNAIAYHEIGALRDRFAYTYLNDVVLRRLTERDQAHDPRARRPEAIYEDIANINSHFIARQSAVTTRRLTTPFDYPNCEQIGDAHNVMDALYSDRFLGLSSIEQRNNLVLTGPRGCGKTTVFRSLSLKHRVLVNRDIPPSIDYIGVYYRCDDLWSAFPRYRPPVREDAIDLPLHFLTATLLAELLEAVDMWAGRHFGTELTSVEQRVAQSIWELLAVGPAPGPMTLRAIAAWLQSQRRYAVNSYRGSNNPGQRFPEFFRVDLLSQVCDAMTRQLTFLANRPVFFLIDDYSTPKISQNLQENLNRLLMHRSAACFFKISTESTVSFVPRDIDGKHYVESREYSLVNLGVDFLYADPRDKLSFIDDVFGRRLGAVEDYPVRSLHDLLGDGPGLSENEAARRIRAGERIEYWGRDVFQNLSSGDIHFLIQLLSKMVAAAGGPDGLRSVQSAPRVSPAEQNKAIRDEAGGFLRNLRSLERGAHLVNIVSAFGGVAHSYLQHRNSKNEEGNPPHQATRIEPFEDPTLGPEAQGFYEDLLRYAVFIEDVRGKSRRGRVVPRLHLRRFLVPHFNLTFSKRDSVELERAELEELLLQPDNFENRKRLRRSEDGTDVQPRLPGT